MGICMGSSESSASDASRSVESESSADAVIQTLRKYAETRVEEHRQAIVENLHRVTGGSALFLDIGFPGAAYFSVAAGGVAEVLYQLGDQCVQVDRVSGASGGACSGFLILANQQQSGKGPSRCPNSEVLLRSYMEYGESEGTRTLTRNLNGFMQTFGVSAFWDRKYRELLQNEANWEAIRERAFCAVSARPIRHSMGTKKKQQTRSLTDPTPFDASSDNYLLHDFGNKEQAVQAYVATGEATAKGFMQGIHVIDAEEHRKKEKPRDVCFSLLSCDGSAEAQTRGKVTLPKTFCDGGKPVVFGVLPQKSPPSSGSLLDKSKNAYLYYHTFYDSNKMDIAFVTPESIERLFYRGVDAAIECLSNPGLLYENGSEKMVVVLPDADPLAVLSHIGCTERGFLEGAFVSLRKSEVFETA